MITDMGFEEEEDRDEFLARLNRSTLTLAFPVLKPRQAKMYAAG